jgi:hypothetical protein
MIIDNNAIFSGSIVGSTVTGQALTTGTITSTNVYDLGVARDIMKGVNLVIPIEVTTTFVGGTSMQAQLVEADDAGISVNVTVLSTTGPTPTANLTAGTRFVLEGGRVDPFPNRRYLAVQYVIVGTYTAGAVFAALQPNEGISDVPENYASGFVVL